MPQLTDILHGGTIFYDESFYPKVEADALFAELRAEIHASRLMVLHAAWKMEKDGAHGAREEISLVKFYVADVLQKTLDRAIQVHGALGITDDTILASFYRHERAARIYDGPDEVHKVSVAKRILRGYGIDAG